MIPIRKTSQHLLPEIKPAISGKYDIYPSFNIGKNLIYSGYKTLAAVIAREQIAMIDGYVGVLWKDLAEKLETEFRLLHKKTRWITTTDYIKKPEKIDGLISPFTVGDDPLFGKRADLELEDFFETGALERLRPDNRSDISIVIGPGAALSSWNGLLVYADLPKNEIQFRARAGSITNLGASAPDDPKRMYKRFYFVDWPVLNSHKKKIIRKTDIIADLQNIDNPAWMHGDTMRESLSALSRNAFRVRPWFEPGAWGGDWIKNHIPGLNTDVPNYAWSFELITPENGLLFESSGRLMEVSFDMLMFLEAEKVLGDRHNRFGNQFPIRFDFLDTFDGGNLSIQCHPRPGYIKEHFGEDYTQEEAYYILDTQENAEVFLGFTGTTDSDEFRNALENSFSDNSELDVRKFVQSHIVRKHDLLLIPYGTIHGSGKNNLVLEISSTPYIFTFKMYDWLRPDLDGRPRPLNIGRAMDNLFFDRKGSYVTEKLISKPVMIDQGQGWELWHLPTHETHLYDVHRLVVSKTMEISTGSKFHALNLVEGSSITVETQNGMKQDFHYAETFVIPAAAESYRIINNSEKEAWLVKAFVK